MKLEDLKTAERVWVNGEEGFVLSVDFDNDMQYFEPQVTIRVEFRDGSVKTFDNDTLDLIEKEKPKVVAEDRPLKFDEIQLGGTYLYAGSTHDKFSKVVIKRKYDTRLVMEYNNNHFNERFSVGRGIINNEICVFKQVPAEKTIEDKPLTFDELKVGETYSYNNVAYNHFRTAIIREKSSSYLKIEYAHHSSLIKREDVDWGFCQFKYISVKENVAAPIQEKPSFDELNTLNARVGRVYETDRSPWRVEEINKPNLRILLKSLRDGNVLWVRLNSSFYKRMKPKSSSGHELTNIFK